MLCVGKELQKATHAFSTNRRHAQILDLCMAPGSFSLMASMHNPEAGIFGITLPPDKGGYSLSLPQDLPCTVQYCDITMLAGEFLVCSEDIPVTHPEHGNFIFERPFLDRKFDLVICDGQAFRGDRHHRASYREPYESSRLISSQLIMAMQRIKEGGTFILLMTTYTQINAFRTLYQISQFAEIEIFKPTSEFVLKKTIYVIAKNVRPNCPAAQAFVELHKKGWRRDTFLRLEEVDNKEGSVTVPMTLKAVREWGDTWIKLGTPIREQEIKIRKMSKEQFWLARGAPLRRTKVGSKCPPSPGSLPPSDEATEAMEAMEDIENTDGIEDKDGIEA